MIAYGDTSFLMSVYLPDAHSVESDRRMAIGPDLLVSPFSRVELANAIYRQVFLARFAANDAKRAFENFDSDCRARLLRVVQFPDAAWQSVVDLARRFAPTIGNRTLDSLHVACALDLRADKFWTFDERQAKLAEAVGLDTGA